MHATPAAARRTACSADTAGDENHRRPWQLVAAGDLLVVLCIASNGHLLDDLELQPAAFGRVAGQDLCDQRCTIIAVGQDRDGLPAVGYP